MLLKLQNALCNDKDLYYRILGKTVEPVQLVCRSDNCNDHFMWRLLRVFLLASRAEPAK